VLKVGNKCVIVLPKAFQKMVGVEEGGEVLAEVVGDSIVLRPLKPRVVDVDPRTVEAILAEERGEWEESLKRIVEETGS